MIYARKSTGPLWLDRHLVAVDDPGALFPVEMLEG